MTSHVIQVLRDNIDELEDIELAPDTPLIEGGYIDSFDIINLISVLEREFSVDIPLEGLVLDDFETPERIDTLLEGIGGSR